MRRGAGAGTLRGMPAFDRRPAIHPTVPLPPIAPDRLCEARGGLVGAHSVASAVDLAAGLGAPALRRRGLWIATIAAVRVYRRHRVLELAEVAREGQGLALELPHELLCVARAQAWRGLLLDPPPQPVRVCFVGAFEGTPATPSLTAQVWRCGHVWLAASWRCGVAADAAF